MTQCCTCTDCQRPPTVSRALGLARECRSRDGLQSVVLATLAPATPAPQELPSPKPRPRGKTPEGYCKGEELFRNTHAKKEVHPFRERGKSSDCAEDKAQFVYCIPASGKEKPPHDGQTVCTTRNFKGPAIAWESKVLLSYCPTGVSRTSDGLRQFVQFMAENNGNLYIAQRLTRITKLYTSRRTLSRIKRDVFVEDFQLDDMGMARCLDPHWSAHQWPRFCKLESDESSELELIWKRPKVGTVRKNESFHFHGSSTEEYDYATGQWTEVHNNIDVDAGRREYDVVNLGVRGSYTADPPFRIDHCPEAAGGGGVPVSTPSGRGGEVPPDSREPLPPESGGGTPTRPGAAGGEPVTAEELRRRIEAAL